MAKSPACLLLPLLLSGVISHQAHAATAVLAPELAAYVGREYTLCASVNESPYVYSHSADGMVIGELRGDGLPLLAPDPARIEDISPTSDGGVRIRFATRHLGRITAELVHDTPSQFISTAAIDHFLSLITEDASVSRFRAASGSDVFHYAGSNHCPHEDSSTKYATPEEACAQAKRPCTACFSGVSAIPDLRTELNIGRQVAREVYGFFIPSTHPEKTAALRKLGEKVVANWPSKRRGYNYDFELVTMGTVNAIACPGGHVFVSEELYDMCESPLELECILAHEIAHVEMRHGYRAQKSAAGKAGFGIALGALAGAIAGNGDAGSIAIGAAAGAIAANVAISMAFYGYSRDAEEEADCYAVNYITGLYENAARATMSAAFRKLEYHGEAISKKRESFNAFSTHPMLSSRIDFIENMRMVTMDSTIAYAMTDSQGSEILRVELQGISIHEWTGKKASNPSAVPDDIGGDRPVTEYHTDLRCFGFAKAANSLSVAIELKEFNLDFGSTRIKFDNKEDTSLAPGQTTSFYVFCEKTNTNGPVELSIGSPQTLLLSGASGKKFDLRPIQRQQE